MNKKEYIDALARLIKNRVIFHAPALKEDVDIDLLQVVGINKTLPIFKFAKPMNSLLFKAFVKAQKEVEFNLVTREEFVKPAWRKKLKNLHFFEDEDNSYSLRKCINGLNINYLSHSAFLPGLNEQYLSVNGEKISLDFQQFFLHKKAESGGVIYEIKEFILNGKNYALSFVNPHKEPLKIAFEINIPLPNGYYNFSRVKTGVKITNLTSQESAFFNYDTRDALLKFSCVDGIENCTHACINLRLSLTLNPRQMRRFYFNYGDKAYLFTSPRQIDEFFDLSQRKIFETFDIKLSSRDKTFDQRFNNDLPQKIWLAWSNFECDEESEKEYLRLKESIVKQTANGYLINEHFDGLKQVKIWSGDAFKHVYIVKGEQSFVMAQKTRYFNFKLISRDFFKQTSEIYLCFGK